MPSGHRRPQPDRSRIVDSMGLPPREPVREPYSPTYGSTYSRSRRDGNGGGGFSERSFDTRRAAAAATTGARPDAYDDDRRDNRSSRQYGSESRSDARRSIDARRRPESLPAARSRTISSRRPAIPAFDDDRDRRDLDDLDEEQDELEEDSRSNRRRSLNPARRSEVSRGSALSPRSDRGAPKSDRGGAAPVKGRKRQDSDPHRQPEPWEDFSNAAYESRQPTRSGPRARGDAEERELRRRSTTGRSQKPSSYSSRQARNDDFDLEPPSRSRPGRPAPVPETSPAPGGGGLLNRVLSKVPGGASASDKGRLSGPRLDRSSSRLNRYSARAPSDRRNDDEMELARIEEDEMLQAMQKRRSAANRAARGFDESDPRWYRDESEGRKPGSQLSRASSGPAGMQRQNQERQRTLDALERRDRDIPTMSRTDAVVRSRSQLSSQSRSQPQPLPRSKEAARPRPGASHAKSTREAALAAVTGVSTGAVALSAIDKKQRNGKATKQYDDEEQSDVSTDDDSLFGEPADVHDDDAIPIVVANNANALRNGKQVPVPSSSAKKVAEATSDDDEDSDEDGSDVDESTEQTSEGLETAAKPAPAIPGAAVASTDPPISRSNSRLVATGTQSRAAPKGYMNFTRNSLAAAAVQKTADGRGRPDTDSDLSELSEEGDEDEDEGIVATPKQSRTTPAAAVAASAGGAAILGAGALAAQRSSQAEKDRRRAARLQAEQEQKAADANARAAKAERSAEKRKAKEEASAAAAAAALAAKEAKRNEKIKLKEAKQAEMERKRDEESQARDRAIREKEQVEEQRLLAARQAEREREQKAEARRASRRQPYGATGPKVRSTGIKPLTPQQRHYLLKALVMLQMQSEWEELEKLGALTEYGYPFSSQRSKLTRVKTFERGDDAGEYAGAARDPYANDDAMREAEDLQEPLILRHLFHVHLHTFPGLDQAPEKYWQKRIQPFFDEMAARNFSSSIERGEISKRRLYALAATRYLGSFVARGVGVRGEGETRGPGVGEPGTEKWGVGKKWGKGTVKRGLDRPERIDDDMMTQIDHLFEGQSGDLWRASGKEWSKVRRDWSAFKESIIESETGLEDVISYLDIGNVKNLPPQYRNSVEFARIHAAYIFHALFVTAPNSDDLFKMVRGIHALAPYWGAKQLLKYANAETMISGILSLLLARPGGAKSLIQRVFSYVIGKEATYIQKEFVVPIRKEIDDPELTKKVEDYVRRGDRVESRRMQRESKKRGEDILTTILLSADGKLGKDAENHVLELQRCFALSPYRGNLNYAYPETTPAGADRPPMPSWSAKGAEHTRARKFALLKLLLRESLKRRDREQAVEMASGSLLPAIIKDSLETVFYPAIRSIASAANLSERLGDLQKFIDDMLEVKKSGDDSIEAWVALAARHEQSLYSLFHECAPIAKPLWDWCQLGLDYMALSTTDPEHPADRRAPNLEVNLEELLQDARLSDADVKKVVAEADKLAKYAKWTKVRYELEARKNYLLGRPEAGHPGGVSEAELDETTKREVRDIDAMMADLMAEAGEAIDDGACQDGVRGTEKYDFPWAFYDQVDPLNQHLAGEEEAGQLRVPKPAVGYAPPSLKHIRRVQPLFCELLASKLPEWQSEDVLGQLQTSVFPSKAGGGGNRLSLKPKKPKTTFSESASARGAPNSYPAENKSILSNATSRFGRMRLPSLFGRK